MQGGAAAPRRSRIGRFFLHLLLFPWRKPRKALLVLLLLLLLLGAGGLAGAWLFHDHHLRAARQALEQGHNLAAIRHLRECRRFRPDDPEVLLLGARAARRGGAWSESESLLDRYWRQRGDDEALVLERLLLRATRGELEDVAPLLQARIDQGDPAAPLAREALIAGFLYRYNLAGAEKQVASWLSHQPDDTFALIAQGKLQEHRSQLGEALTSYRRLLSLDPEHDEARLRLTTALLDLSQGEEALEHLEYLRGKLPEHPQVLVQLGQALDLQGRGDEARAVLDECLRLHPNEGEALALRAKMAARAGDDVQAAQDFARAVALEPGDYQARYQYSLVLKRLGNQAEADKQFEKGEAIKSDIKRIRDIVSGPLRTNPKNADLLHEAAMIAARAGKPREMHRYLLLAVQADPNHPAAHRGLAAYYHETGNPILAARHRALAQRGNNRAK